MDYKTISTFSKANFTRKKSNFIGYITPAQTKQQAEDFITKIKAQHWDATHNVWAYIVDGGKSVRYSDDGEPQGTAGIPTLDVIKKEDLINLCVVITRYFGGIMLGAGGLVRAYSHACKLAIDSAKIVNMKLCDRLEISFGYNFYGKINHLIPKHQVKIETSNFAEIVNMTLLVPCVNSGDLERDLSEVTGGKLSIEFKDKTYTQF